MSRAARVLACAVLLLACSGVQAQLFRAYLSPGGKDTNACSLPAPCRLLPAALAAVANGGEIWMLDSGNYNVSPVSITKSVTILAVPGALGSVVALGGNAIDIATPGVKVALRNLTIVPFPASGAANGISMTGGASLTLENCVIANLPGSGITVATGAAVRISDSSIRDNAVNGIALQNGARAAITRAIVSANGSHGVLVQGTGAGTTTTADIGDSTLDGNVNGVYAWSQVASAIVKVSVADSRAVRNATGIAVNSDAGASVTVSASNNIVSNNSGSGISATSSGSKVWATGNTVSDNAIGFSNSGGLFETAGNNVVRHNGVDVSGPLGAQVASQLLVSGFPSSTVAGVAGSVTVTVKDAGGVTLTGYVGTVRFSSNDPQAVLPSDYTFVPGDAGVHTFSSVTLKTAGTRSITATDTGNASVTGAQAGITVTPGAASALFVSGFPSPRTAGVSGSVTVSARDAFNNAVTGYTGTVHFTSSDGLATLPADYTFTVADAGAHSFQATLRTAGNQSISASDVAGVLTSGAQNSIVVLAASPTTFTVFASPAITTAGVPVSLTVAARDSFNNTVAGYAGTVHFTSSDASAILPANYAFTAGDAGGHGFSATLLTAGSQSVTVTETTNASLTGTSNAVTVGPAATSALVVSGFPNAVFSGVFGSFTVRAVDAFGNTTPAYAGTVAFSSTDANAVLPAAYKFGPGVDDGIRTFTGVTLGTASVATALTASDGTRSGSQTSIVVSQGPNLYGPAAAMIVGGTAAGRIFISGGATSVTGTGKVLNTWLYNPADGTIVNGPSLSAARVFHTATALGGGQVLIAGGNIATGAKVFELCNVALTGSTCTATGGTTSFSRCNATAVAIPGAASSQVLLAGGDDCAGGSAVNTWILWDSANPTLPVSSAAGNALTAGRTALAGVGVTTGVVLLAGGSSTASADRFVAGSPLSSSTVAATSGVMTAPRSGHTATLLQAGSTTGCPAGNGPCVLIAGGNGTVGKTWEIYDATSRTFPRNATTAGQDLVFTQRKGHVAAQFLGGKVMLAGGANAAGTPTATTETFDPAAGTLGFTVGPSLLVPRNLAAGVHLTSDLFVIVGGSLQGPAAEQLFVP